MTARVASAVAGGLAALACTFGSHPREALVGIAAHPGGHRGAALAVEDLAAQGIHIKLREASRERAAVSGVAAVGLAQAFDTAGAVAVVGHSVSGATLSAAHILNQRGVPMIIPNATSPLLSGVGRWVFRICADDRAQGEVLAELAIREGRRRAGILYVLDDYGKGLAASFAGAFARRGGELALAVGYSSQVDRPDEDLAPALEALRRVTPDVLLLAVRTRDLVELRGSESLAGPGWPLRLGGDAAYAPLDVGDRPALFEGMIVTVLSPPDSPAARRFEERYRRRYGTAPDNPSYACYDAVTLVGRALREVGSDRAAVRSFLRSLGRERPAHEGLTGRIRFGEEGGALDAGFALARVAGGRLALLSP